MSNWKSVCFYSHPRLENENTEYIRRFLKVEILCIFYGISFDLILLLKLCKKGNLKELWVDGCQKQRWISQCF